MRDALRKRTVIIGNAGSGKSTLAAHVGAFAGCACVDLDAIYWEDQLALRKRVKPAAIQMLAAHSLEPTWVIEGVYGWLADVATPRATALVWLDLQWDDCRAGLEARGPSGSSSEAEYDGLLAWAGQYWTRKTPSSHAGHQSIFDGFAGCKAALRSRGEVAAFVNGLVAARAGLPHRAPFEL